jgi:hypothetical protein
VSSVLDEHRFHDRRGSVGENLDPDTEQDKRREADQDTGAVFPEQPGDGIGRAIAEIDGQAGKHGSDERGDDLQPPGFRSVADVGSEGEGDGDGAGADGERHGERVEGERAPVAFPAPGGGLTAFLPVLFGALEEIPAGSGDEQATADLHDGERDAEEAQDVGADEEGADEEAGSVPCDASGQAHADGSIKAWGEAEEDGRGAHRIDDGEESQEDDQSLPGRVGRLVHHYLASHEAGRAYASFLQRLRT